MAELRFEIDIVGKKQWVTMEQDTFTHPAIVSGFLPYLAGIEPLSGHYKVYLHPWDDTFEVQLKNASFASRLEEAAYLDALEALPWQPSYFTPQIEAIGLLVDWRKLSDQIKRVLQINQGLPHLQGEMVALATRIDALFELNGWHK